MPLRQVQNRVWRTYTGGDLIDAWKGTTCAAKDLPEEWIMSTVEARGINRPADEGLSKVITPEGIFLLKELIAQNPELFLGRRMAARYGSMGVLIKLIDSAERLTIQVHPDKEYAKKMLNSKFGKTEAWYILGKREINSEKASVFLGFKEGITEEIWRDLFMRQDVAGMLNRLHRFDVNPGDVFIIHGGVPHAIGSGCFLLEIQEPTDYTMRVEKVTPGGLKIGDALIHQGVGIENMLKCFHYDGVTYTEATEKWKITPAVDEKKPDFTLRSLISTSQTDCFSMKELDLRGEIEIEGNGDFFAGIVCSGSGSLISGEDEYTYNTGDGFFFPAAISRITFRAEQESKILLCYPPS
jgi:mannose-6-phosphate isomerase